MTPDYLCLSTNLTSTEAAAWVQAIGSILAIAAAIWISWQQAKLARESVVNAQLIADRARQNGILAIAEAAVEHARRFDEALVQSQSGDPFGLYVAYDQTIIRGVVQALTDVPAYEVGSRDAVIALLNVRDQFQFLGRSIEVYKDPRQDPELAKLLSEAATDSERQEIWSQLKANLAQNVKARVATIRSNYDLLKMAIDGAAPELAVGAGDEAQGSTSRSMT
jgi:hypothetical protein